MAIQAGLLIQPYASVIWGGINLSAYPGATGELERLAQGVSLSFSKTEEAPSCEFTIAPTVDGFDVVGQIRNSPELLKQVVDVAIGFDHLPDRQLNCQYLFSGLAWTTGLDPALKFTLTSAIKSAWTDNRINFTMEEEMPLSEFPDFLKDKAGAGAKYLKFKFVGQAETDASDIMIKVNRMNQSPQTILAETMKEHGMEIRTGDTAMDGTVVIGYAAAKDGELDQDKPVLEAQPAPGVRAIHILGPTLMQNVSRKQEFAIGQSDTQGGAKSKATAATDTENVKVAKKAPLPQQAAAVSSTEPKVRTAGTSDPAQARSGTTKSVGDKEDARAALAQQLVMTLDASFPMVPQVCGMKPGDILAIPALKGPGSWIEDYEITEVKYQFNDTGEVMMSINAQRPYVGTENLMDGASVAAVQSRVASLTSPEAWAAYYWRQGPSS